MSSPQPVTPEDWRRRAIALFVLLLFALVVLALLYRGTLTPTEVAGPGPRPVPTTGPTAGPTTGPTTGPTGSPTSAPGAGAGTGTGSGTTPDGATFALTSVVVGGLLPPGQPQTLRVTATNPGTTALRVQSVSATVGTPDRAGCSPTWLTVDPFSSTTGVTLPAGGTAVLDLRIEFVDLPDTNQNACKGATFPLRLAGSGVEQPG